jgi:hypothetical protein
VGAAPARETRLGADRGILAYGDMVLIYCYLMHARIMMLLIAFDTPTGCGT